MIKVGEKAPHFILSNKDGQPLDMATYIGKKPLVIYFYPKNFTPGCVAEACSFRDSFQDFEDAGAIVFGISSDSVASHERFAKRYKLPFSTLSDSGGKIRKLYGVKGDLLGLLPGRETFVIDKEGIIKMRFNSMQASKHIEKALKLIKSL